MDESKDGKSKQSAATGPEVVSPSEYISQSPEKERPDITSSEGKTHPGIEVPPEATSSPKDDPLPSETDQNGSNSSNQDATQPAAPPAPETILEETTRENNEKPQAPPTTSQPLNPVINTPTPTRQTPLTTKEVVAADVETTATHNLRTHS